MKLSHLLSAFLKRRLRADFSEKRRRESGFTLLELLVVIVILGLLIGLVAPAVLRQLGNAKISIAKQSVAQIESVLDLYKLDAGSYPSTQDGLQALVTKPDDVDSWAGPYLKGNVPKDPWGHDFLYQSPSSRSGLDYDLCSLGPSGAPGAPGDAGLICNH
jgi:general secretion pathway protein G